MKKTIPFAAAGCLLAGVAAAFAGPLVPAAAARPEQPVLHPTETRLAVGEGADRAEFTIRVLRRASDTECRVEWKAAAKPDGAMKTICSPAVRVAHGRTGHVEAQVAGAPFELHFRDGAAN